MADYEFQKTFDGKQTQLVKDTGGISDVTIVPLDPIPRAKATIPNAADLSKLVEGMAEIGYELVGEILPP